MRKRLEALIRDAANREAAEKHDAIQIVTEPAGAGTSAKRAGAKRTANSDEKNVIVASPVRSPWVLGPAAALVLLGGWVLWRFMSPSTRAREVPTEVVERPKSKPLPKVSALQLKSLRLSEVPAADARVMLGEAARFKVRLENTSVDASSDPRRTLANASSAAKVTTYLKAEGGARILAPAYAQKLSAAQLPAPGASVDIELQFLATKLPTKKYEVVFELQTPDGAAVSSVSTQTEVLENLAQGELLGFEMLRIHQGIGGDVSIKSMSESIDAAANTLSVHLPPNPKDPANEEQLYLRFDLSKLAFAREQIDRAVVTMTMHEESFQGKSNLQFYAIPEDLTFDWRTGPESELSWEMLPSSKSLKSLVFLETVVIDNTSGRLKDRMGEVRLFGSNLDDFIRQSRLDALVLVVVRNNRESSATRFYSKEASPEKGPALALRKTR